MRKIKRLKKRIKELERQLDALLDQRSKEWETLKLDFGGCYFDPFRQFEPSIEDRLKAMQRLQELFPGLNLMDRTL